LRSQIAEWPREDGRAFKSSPQERRSPTYTLRLLPETAAFHGGCRLNWASGQEHADQCCLRPLDLGLLAAMSCLRDILDASKDR
jgi:hypothetical protein